MLLLTSPVYPALPENSIWQREYWDRFIRDEKHFHAAIAYIHDNPVSAGVCARREDWHQAD